MPPFLVALAVVATVLIFAVFIFLPAGRMDWAHGWVYIGIVTVNMLASWVCLLRWNPVLIERRLRFGKGTKTWDRIWAVSFAPLLIAVYVVAGIDARDSYPSLPLAAWVLGLVVFVSGAIVLTWSMVVNPFFEKTVRIQKEHGHRVIDTGPYAYVRHPGYLGFLGWILATPLLLDSAHAFIPALLAMAGVVVRTALEDRTLQAELDGYGAYAARVRFRLIRGIW